jgi:nuclease-like protein
VRTIELSNNPADALRLAGQRRDDAGRRGGPPSLADVTDALARHELLVRRAASARDRARAQRHWLAWLRGAVAVGKLRRLAPPPTPGVAGAAREAEPVKEAGLHGERQVVADLGKELGDDWVLVRGYCNRRGEIDYLLLGPAGLVAIESRHLAGTVACDGDEWRFTTLAGGDAALRGPLADRRGRSPSVQLNEPAGLLEEFLSSRGGKVSMLRVVLLTHPDAKLGWCKNATVHIAASARELARQLGDMPPVIGAVQRARLEELIARDHRYQEQPRSPSGPPRGRRRRPRSAGARTDRSARSASR